MIELISIEELRETRRKMIDRAVDQESERNALYRLINHSIEISRGEVLFDYYVRVSNQRRQFELFVDSGIRFTVFYNGKNIGTSPIAKYNLTIKLIDNYFEYPLFQFITKLRIAFL